MVDNTSSDAALRIFIHNFTLKWYMDKLNTNDLLLGSYESIDVPEDTKVLVYRLPKERAQIIKADVDNDVRVFLKDRIFNKLLYLPAVNETTLTEMMTDIMHRYHASSITHLQLKRYTTAVPMVGTAVVYVYRSNYA